MFDWLQFLVFKGRAGGEPGWGPRVVSVPAPDLELCSPAQL